MMPVPHPIAGRKDTRILAGSRTHEFWPNGQNSWWMHNYRLGYGLGVLNRESLNLQFGVEAQRRNSPMLGAASNGVLGQATVGW